MNIKKFILPLFLMFSVFEVHAFDFDWNWFDDEEPTVESQQPDVVPESVKAERAILLNPYDRIAHLSAARSYIEEGFGVKSKQKAAKSHLKKLLLSNPNDLDALLLAGQLRLMEGNLEFAMEYYKKATSISPNDPRAYLGLGDVFNRLNNEVAAAEAFEKFRILSNPQ